MAIDNTYILIYLNLQLYIYYYNSKCTRVYTYMYVCARSAAVRMTGASAGFADNWAREGMSIRVRTRTGLYT